MYFFPFRKIFIGAGAFQGHPVTLRHEKFACMGYGISFIPAAHHKLILHRLPQKRKPQRYLLSCRIGQSQFVQDICVHNDLIALHGHMPFLQRDEHIRQYIFIRCKTNLRLTLSDIVRHTKKDRITAFYHQRIFRYFLILFPRCRLDSRVKASAYLPHGILLGCLHGAACQGKNRRKQNTCQGDGKDRKYITHPVVFQAPPGQSADGRTVIVSHTPTSPESAFLTGISSLL